MSTKVCCTRDTTRRALRSCSSDEKKLQQLSMENNDDGNDDLPRIDLTEMLADMTMEESDVMEA
jgi:hypothetical protein